MRWLVIMLIVFAGCVASLPDDSTVSADLATEAARMLVSGQSAPPAPAPGPSDGRCENCDGTGKVKSGDGIMVFDCPECGGTGERAVVHPAVTVPCPECKL